MHQTVRIQIAMALLVIASTALADIPPPAITSGGSSMTGANGGAHTSVGQPLAGPSGIGVWYLVVASNDGPVSGVPDAPAVNRLGQNVPNPFNPMTTISFSTAEAGRVRLRLFNVRGQMVAELVNRQMPAGEHSLVFRPTRLASGVYFYRLETGSFSETRRLLLLK